MKQIKVNQSNNPYYSEDFIKGFECGTKTQFDADKEVIYRIKQTREEIKSYCEYATDEKQKVAFNACLMAIDKLIVESER